MSHYWPATTHRAVRDPINHATGYEGIDPTALISHGGEKYVVMLLGGIFHAEKVRYQAGQSWHSGHEEEKGNAVPFDDSLEGVLYQPIHASVTLADVEGATYCRDDGTYWTDFSRKPPGGHYDTEALVEALLIAHFQPRINRAQRDYNAANDITARTLASNRVMALGMFVDDALVNIEEAYRKVDLGQHERETPHEDNHRKLVVGACAATLAAWETKARTEVRFREYRRIALPESNALVAELSEKPKVATRAENAAAAAKKAKEAEEEEETE